MSLDVTLYGPEEAHTCTCPTCYNEHQATRKEKLYSENITHNLCRMADAAGLYTALWRPEEEGWHEAGQLIEPLALGLEALRANPEEFKKLNPANGWGSYEGLVRFTENYLAACRKHPTATVHADR